MKNFLEHLLWILSGIFALFVVCFAVRVLVSLFSSSDKEPPNETGIEAVNQTEYSSIDEMNEDDFQVYMIYDDDSRELLSENIVIDFDSAKPIGETALVSVYYTEYAEDEETVLHTYSCDTEVHVKREKILGIPCGHPNLEDVTAVVYSNGELCFEGEGDIIVCNEGGAPWLSSDIDCTIKSVSFSEGVAPTNMNYWFEGMNSLTYCDTIPSSVITMIRTFYGCGNLTEAADWTDCPNLLIATECYRECAALDTIRPLPGNLKVAEYTFKNCLSLSGTADMTNAVSLTDAVGMYSGCEGLVEIQMCPNVIDMSKMFEGCINLKNMPFIPATTQNMDSAFEGDVSLIVLTSIPESVSSMNSTFANCQMLQGDLLVDTSCESCNNMFSGAVLATRVNLVGSSEMLHVYANTCSTGNVTVNGQSANPNLTSAWDVAAAEESREAEESERASEEAEKESIKSSQEESEASAAAEETKSSAKKKKSSKTSHSSKGESED